MPRLTRRRFVKRERPVVAKQLKILVVAAARPNFMKVAPIIQQIVARREAADATATRLDYRLVHTGQHYDAAMSDVFFRDLGIPAPHINLGVGSGSHAVQTAQTMLKFEPVCVQERPDWVVVVGDVNATLACTLVCAKLQIPVAHVEAGLRSGDRSMPEEINRLATDAVADLLLTPSSDADENLLREGVAPHKIKLVGNVMIDSLIANLNQSRASGVLERLRLAPDQFVYVTLHRPSNVDQRDSLQALMAALAQLSTDFPVVFPIHPRTRKMCQEFGISLEAHPGVQVIEPLGYHDSLCLTESARFVLTDSGGLQEESTYFRTPCLTLRPNTERPVTVTLGSNRLTRIETLSTDIAGLLRQPRRLGQIPPFWDGRAAERIVDQLIVAS